MILARFITDDALAHLEQSLHAGSENEHGHAQAVVALAFHLRQRNPERSERLAASLLRSAVTSPGQLGTGASGWLLLTLAEISAHAGLLQQAAEHLTAAERLFSRAEVDTAAAATDAAAAGLSDCHALRATMAMDTGELPLRDLHTALAVDRALASRDPQRIHITRLSALLASSWSDPGQFSAASQSLQPLLQLPDDAVRSYVTRILSFAALNDGDFAQGISQGSESMRCSLGTGQLRSYILQTAQIGMAYIELGDHDAGIELLSVAVDKAREFPWPQALAGSLYALGHGLQAAGRLEAARDLADEAVSILQGFPGSKNYLAALHSSAALDSRLGQHEQARAKYLALLDVPALGENIEMRMFALLGLADAALGLAQDPRVGADDAERYATEGHALAHDKRKPTEEVEGLRLLARIAAARGDRAGALNLLLQARKISEAFLQPEATEGLLESLADAYTAQGQLAEALQTLKAAAAARSSAASSKAARTAVMTEVRLKTANALAEATRQRELAAAEAQRALQLEELNAQLRDAMDVLQKTQALLVQRNQELTDAYARISELSLTDPLTGLRNRRFLDQVIEKDVARCLRSYHQSRFASLDAHTPGEQSATGGTSWQHLPQAPEGPADIVFILIDLDHFKQVNDVHGHGAGDAVLKQLAKRLLDATRTEDHVVRWGGEEFLVAVRGVDRSMGWEIAERIRTAVAAAPFPIGDGVELFKTCSIGFAAFPPDPVMPQAGDWHQVVEAADAHLYEAKRTGRNKCVGPAPAAEVDPDAQDLDRPRQVRAG